MKTIINGKASPGKRQVTRRDFIKTSAAVSLTAMLPSAVFAAGSDKVRVGLIGCGGRGTGAAADCLISSPGVELVALGDLFQDQLDKAVERIESRLDRAGSSGRVSEDAIKAAKMSINVPKSKMFSGFDNFKKVIRSKVDLVIFATPPHFRPEHFEAAVKAGKHVFMEKPVAVDPGGIRSVIASAEAAKKKNLSVVAGTQRRHQDHYLDIMKRLHDGQIGEIVGGQCYWNMEALWVERAAKNLAGKRGGWSDMEFQVRNWLFYTWLSGDHIVEQHVHNLDVMNWAIGSHPVKAMGMGGRQARNGEQYGNIFDHFAIEYEYADGQRVLSMCRQTAGASNRVSERVVGTNGATYTDSSNGYIEGPKAYKPDYKSPNPYVQEHADLIASIRNGEPLNEAKRVAESTLTAIMGRMSAYTGRELKWDWVMNASKLDLSPPNYKFGDLVADAVAIPGQTKLI